MWVSSDAEEQTVIEQMATLPDRIVAIVSAALVEARIDKALKRRFLDNPKRDLVDRLLSDSRGTGSLGIKNQLALCLGVYSHQAMQDIHQLKEIRNVFAHRLAIDRFDDSPVRERCQNLKLVDEYVFDSRLEEASIKWVKGLTQQMEDRDRIVAIPRMRFQITVALITTGLYLDDQVILTQPTPPF